MPKTLTPKLEYEELADVELDAATSERIDRAIAQAESEFHDTRVNFRWGTEQLDIVKRAAAMVGVPYQTYLKQVVYKQAIADLEASDRAMRREDVQPAGSSRAPL